MHSISSIISLVILSLISIKAKAGFTYGTCLDSPIISDFNPKQVN
jgi:hypothetical protein